MRRAHPEAMDGLQAKEVRKARWSTEELAIMARHEAGLAGRVRFMNEALVRLMPGRSLEAIKGQRRKREYTELVERYKRELRDADEPDRLNDDVVGQTSSQLPSGSEPIGTPSAGESNDYLIKYLEDNIPPPDCEYRVDVLRDIIGGLRNRSIDDTFVALSAYIEEIFPVKVDARQRGASNRQTRAPLSRRKRRGLEYALTQKNFKKHPARCLKTILDGPVTVPIINKGVMSAFWENVFTQESRVSPGVTRSLAQDVEAIWAPIDIAEVKRSMPAVGKAPGADGISPREWRVVPNSIKCAICNLILLCERAPGGLLRATTTLIPKGNNADEPSKFRPITVASVILRHVNSILSCRVTTLVQIDDRQRAFRPIDGCAVNTVLLDLILGCQKSQYSTVHMAILDVSKAYDSVSHNAIYDTLKSYNFPSGFIRYMKHSYENATTSIRYDDWVSNPIRPLRGVKQGDPLSPCIFNLIIDRVLKQLPEEVGALVGEQRCNAIAFADDIVLASESKVGLETLLQRVSEALSQSGLSLNPAKCRTISLRGQPKFKNTVLEHGEFRVGGVVIPSLSREDTFEYLGVPFTATGRSVANMVDEVRLMTERLSKAPLRPQQRLHALRVFVIPRIMHRATLSRVHLGVLRKIDIRTRRAVRGWLDLPHDTPIAYFHAAVRDGGLGIPSIRWQAPLVRRARLDKVKLPGVAANTYIARELDLSGRRLQSESGIIRSRDQLNAMWRERLRRSVDGSGLKEAPAVHQAHRWVDEPTALLRPRDFIRCLKVRINALPTRSRTSRGRPGKDRRCRAGCDAPESLNHVLQQCPRTHGARIARHDAVVKYMAQRMQGQVDREVIFRVGDVTLKPDIVQKVEGKVQILDAQVITDSYSLEVAHQNKRAKYSSPEFLKEVGRRYQVSEVDISVSTVTLNWRGIWSAASAADLLSRDLVARRDLAVLSARVLVGALNIFSVFNRGTMPARWR